MRTRSLWFRWTEPATLLFLGGLLVVATAGADERQAAGKPPAAPAVKEAAKSEKPKRFPDFKDVTKDLKELPGLFTLYRADPDDENQDPQKLLCQIPKGLLNEDLLFATSISRGGYFTGWMWKDYLVRWEVVGKHLKLVTPDTRYVHKEGQPITDAVERTYNEQFLAAIPIVTMPPGGDVVIDLGTLLKSNLADVSFMGGGGGVRPELSKWTKTKVFPDNVLIDVDLAIAHRDGGGQSVGVSYVFRRLPKLGSYKPRGADDRIGYFLTARMDWSREVSARDTFERYINRWELEKRDPALSLSPPKKPITFIIEKTVPIQWRRWVRQGILEWNKAFEQIGFVDAIVVQQQTDDNEFADYDPEDARYNFFRWIVSGSSFAMGPSRVDPRTGQILDADIIMDDSFVRVFMQDLDFYAPAAVADLKGPGFRTWMEQEPEMVPALLARQQDAAEDSLPALLAVAEEKLHANGHHVCSYARGMQQQMTFVHNALIATGSGKELPEHFIGEAIREVVTHEVGHTLGLRHNFKGSSWLALDEIKRRRDETDEPTCASIMDYNPLLFFADDKADQVRHFVTPTIGPWDYWVIEYGYRVPGDGTPEREMLKQIAARCAEEGLDYATDEDTRGIYSPDPLTNTYDYSADPLGWADSRRALCDKLLDSVAQWAVQKGEPRYFIRRAFDTICFEKARNLEYVARLVGGQYFHRDHVGDPNARPAFKIVAAQTQRAALKLLGETLFADEYYAYDKELLNQLAPSRWNHWGSSAPLRLDYPIHDHVASMQLWTLMDITSAPVLQRIYDAQLKTDAADRFTAAELIKTVRDQIWHKLKVNGDETYSDGEPMISSLSRGLQRQYLEIMLNLAQGQPGWRMSADLQGMVRYALQELSGQIGRTLKNVKKLDFASRAHLVECKSRIDRVLEAQFNAR